MHDLYSFYRSKEWQSLLNRLKIERLNDEGQLICDYCGKPMIKAYDIIGHHKEESSDPLAVGLKIYSQLHGKLLRVYLTAGENSSAVFGKRSRIHFRS